MELGGAVALVTGGGSGLGEAIAHALAEAGATVVVGDLEPERARRVADAVRVRGHRAAGACLDVADEDSVARFVREAVAEHGRVDVAVNNAGVDVTAPVEELAVADWDRILGVNLRGAFLVARETLPHMRSAGRGHIVNIVSTAAKRAWPNAAAYHASKWGLLGLSHALHAEARAYGVKVTAVVSGGMRTPFLLDRFPDIDQATLQDPRTVAETVRFVLAQPDASVVPEVMVLPMRESSWP